MVFTADEEAIIDALQNAVDTIEEELGIDPGGVYANVRVRLDILEARINNPLAPAPNVENPFFIGNDGVTISTGTGAPTENRLPGSLYLRQNGADDEGLYAYRPDGYWHLVPTDVLFPKIQLDGYKSAGAAFTLNTVSDGYLTLENAKAYDINIRILLSNTSGTPTCARYVYDILAHCESGTLTLDAVNSTLITDNSTGWTVSFSTSTTQLIVQIDASGALDRQGIASVEFREISRL